MDPMAASGNVKAMKIEQCVAEHRILLDQYHFSICAGLALAENAYPLQYKMKVL